MQECEMKRYIRALKSALALAMILCIMSGVGVAENAKVYSSKMKVYSKANSDSKYYLGSLSKGVKFDVLKTSGGWAYIEYKDKKGYAKVSDLRAIKGVKMYANANATVYNKPGGSSIGKLNLNTLTYMVGWSGDYYLIDNGSGKTGYVQKKYLSKSVTAKNAYTNCAAPVYKSSGGSSKLCTLAINTGVSVIGYSGSYCKVRNKSNGAVGYILKSQLSSGKTTLKAAYTNAACSVYKSAGSGKLSDLKINTLVYVIGESGSYYKVTDSSKKQTGYIQKSKLSSGKTAVKAARGTYKSSTSTTSMPSSLKSSQSKASSSLSNKQKLEAVIYYAQSRLGCYYSTKPNNTTTYDCLTLLYYGFKAVGVKIPDSSYKLGYTGNYQTITSISSLKRGDIVCFDTIDDGDLSDHVGIYLGSGYMLHASSGAGMVVVSTMKSGYYKETFTCGRRILK